MPQTTAALPPVLWDTMWHTAAVPAGAEAVGEPVPDASEAEPARESGRDAVRSDGAMVLLAPSIAAAPAGLSDDVAGLADTPRSPAADRLARLLDDQPLPAAGAADDARPDRAMPPDDPAWPRLAESLGGGALHDLFSRLLCDPAIVDGTFPGLTPRRVEKLLPPSARPLAAALLVWCDRAGLLDGPVTAHEPLRHPRRLLLADLDAIAARLRATPLPAEDEVRAALLGKGARS